MNRKHIAIIFILTLPFLFWNLMRPDIVGADSYFFLNLACNSGGSGLNYLFSFLPCDIIAIKLMLFGVAFLTALSFGYLGRLFDKENGWMLGFMFWLNPWFIEFLSRFENDVFAFPFFILSIYFLFSAVKTGKQNHFILSIALAIFAGCLWKAIWLWLIVPALFLGWLGLVAICAVVFVNWNFIFSQAFGLNTVAENKSFGFIGLNGLSLFGVFGLTREPLAFMSLVVFTAMAMIKMQLWIMAAPFYVLGLLLLIKKYSNYPAFKSSLISVAVVFALFGGLILLGEFPQQEYHDAIEYALSISEDNKIQNDWDIGHIVKWHGGITDSHSSPYEQQEFGSGIIVTTKELSCNIVQDFRHVHVYRC